MQKFESERGDIMSKKLRMILTGILFSLVFTFGIALVNEEEAKADWYFSRTNIDKCDVYLDRNHFDWDGKAHFPKATIYYKGELLTQNVDYTVKYYNNTDAGTGYLKIKGINNYRGSRKAYFKIEGIDLPTECTFTVRNGRVQVYYNDKIVASNNYLVSDREVYRREIRREPSGDRNTEYIVYEVCTEYTIQGKRQYSGYVTIDEVLEERVLVEKEHPEPPHGPGHGPHPGGPGHGPEPHPGPGGPGHGRP